MSFILKSLVKIKTETLGLESTQNLACTIFRRNPFLPETEQSPKLPSETSRFRGLVLPEQMWREEQWRCCWGLDFSQSCLPYSSHPVMLSTQELRETNNVCFLSSLPCCLNEILWQKQPEGEKPYFSLSQGFSPSRRGGQDSGILEQPVTSHSQWGTESSDGILAGAPISVSSLCNPNVPAKGMAQFIDKVGYPVSTKRIKLIPHIHAQKPIFWVILNSFELIINTNHYSLGTQVLRSLFL